MYVLLLSVLLVSCALPGRHTIEHTLSLVEGGGFLFFLLLLPLITSKKGEEGGGGRGGKLFLVV